ncbi:alpha/beta fold hydrolase [Rhodoligotrophos defluvii]|uniref:alpha/beta fold hydrolase n=1 Tax=Rhodoligotrophos defluvii TaxID=2561934 RepID=UPI0010C935EF|nr:alpha/beta hydrolase [Rhodoligotrophos defluvii]
MKSALVFIHGLGGAGEIWFRQEQHFARERNVLAWDAPGCKGKPLLHPLTFPALAEALLADLDAAQIKRAVLVGHSLGGMLAQTVVARAPERVAGLALVSTSPAFGDPKGAFQQQFIRERLEPLDRGIPMADFAGPATAAMVGEDPDLDCVALTEKALAATPPETYRAYINLLTTFDARATLGAIGCPTLVIVGEHDKASPPVVSEKMARRIPQGIYVMVPGAGHMLPFERPTVFNAALEGFLVDNGL